MVVVVPNAALITRGTAGRFNPAHYAGARQRVERVVNGLLGDGSEPSRHRCDDLVDPLMGSLPHRFNNGHPHRRHPKSALPKLLGGIADSDHKDEPIQFLD